MMATVNGLADDVSNLNLNQSSEASMQHETKKHRRPHRIYHNFETAGPSFDRNSPSSSQQSTPLMQQSQIPYGTPLSNDNPYRQAGTPANGLGINGLSINTLTLSAPQPTTTHFVSAQRLGSQQNMLRRTFMTSTDSVPPLSTTQYYAEDQATADPRLMSLSMYNVPNDEHLRAATKLPVGITVQPFAKLIPVDSIPVADATVDSDGPMRCRRCRSYVNSRYQFTFDSKMICNLCHIKSNVPVKQLSPLGLNGLRADAYERPELLKGAVDFLVPSSYNISRENAPVPLHYVFLLDISAFANENKSSLAAIEGIRTSIEYMVENQPNCKVAIIAFDEWIRFFNIRADLEQTQEHIINDPKDIFLPINKGLFALPSEAMHVIQDVLVKLETYITDERFLHRSQSCYGSALEAAKLALEAATNNQGGKIIACLNTLPTTGRGNLSLMRDDGLKKHLRCEDEFYKKLAHDFLKSWIGIDLFVTSTAYIDLATTSYPVIATSGHLHHYSNFNINKDEFRFVNDILGSVKCTVGYQGMLKVRCSSGLSVYNYYSESVKNTDEDPVIPVLTRDQKFDVLFKYDDTLKVGEDVCFQAALLYTDIHGVRKVRAINTTAAVNSNVIEVFKFVNQDVVSSIMIKDVLATLEDCNFNEIRKNIDRKIIEIFTQYRALCGGSSGGQLILPDSLKTLPMYMLAFEKSELMKQNKSSSRGNERFYDYYKLLSYGASQLSYKLYPQIIPLHDSLDEDDLSFYDDKMQLLQFNNIETLSVRSSHRQLINGGCYLIFQGESCFLWMNENTNPMLIRDLLSYEGPINQLDIFGGRLPDLDTDINIKARNVIKNWSQIINIDYLPVVPLRPNVDPYYSHVMNQLMVEDKSIELVESFDNYLIALHHDIKENIKNDKYIKIGKSAEDGHENFAQKFVHF
ncbi:Sfb3 [Kluyveromyces lactis]|nr:Sfb3 [Kluyveromyces lactis]